MQVFKAFFKVLKIKLPVALIYIVVFLSIAIPMAKSGSEKNDFQQTRLRVCIFDEDSTAESQYLCAYIAERHDLIELENDRDVITDALYYERADYVLTINKGYAERLASRDTEGLFSSYHMHDSYSTVLMVQMLDEYVSAVRSYIAGGKDISEAVTSAEEILSQEAEVTVASFDSNSSEYPRMFAFYFRYMPYILLSALLSTLCPVLLVMNRRDIRFRTNCSSVRPGSYSMQLFAGSMLFIAAIWLVFMIAGIFVYGGIYQGRAWLAVLNSFIFAGISAALTVFISGFSPSVHIVNLITQVLGLGMSFLCGVFVDQSMLGSGVLAAARFLPAYWYIRANDMLSGAQPYSSEKLVQCLVIEAAFAVVIAIVTVLVHRLKYSSAAPAKVK